MVQVEFLLLFFRWNEVLRVQVEFVVPFSARGGCFLQVSRGL